VLAVNAVKGEDREEKQEADLNGSATNTFRLGNSYEERLDGDPTTEQKSCLRLIRTLNEQEGREPVREVKRQPIKRSRPSKRTSCSC